MKSDLRKRIYEFIVAYIRMNGMPPTIREIGDALHIASTGHVEHHVKALEKEGRLRRLSGLARGIRLTQPVTSGVPVLGTIAAGVPLDIFPSTSETVFVDQPFQTARSFALLVRGTSMIEDHICDGDYVVIHPQSACENGDIIVAVHFQDGNGSATLKRFFLEKDHVRLQPANSDMAPFAIPRREWDTEWHIQGRVIAILRSVQKQPPPQRD